MSKDAGDIPHRLLGSEEAARFLGIHRSTLHLAANRKLLVPDQTTPGGHLRFSIETLDAYRERLRRAPATSRPNPLGPMRAVADLAHRLTVREDAEAVDEVVCRAAVASIRRTQPEIEMCGVGLIERGDDGTYQLRSMASEGFPDWVYPEYNRLRRNAVEFATSAVLRGQMRDICEDTEDERLRYGTRLIVGGTGLRSYAVLPILAGNRALGALAVASSKPRRFGKRVLAFLEAIANEIALGVRIENYLDLTGALIAYALDPDAAGERDAPTNDAHRTRRVAALRDIFTSRTGAAGVYTLGFAEDAAFPAPPPLRDLMRRTSTGEGVLSAEWGQGGGAASGIATAIIRVGEAVSAVGAMWAGKRSHSPADHALLLTFAAAVELAHGRQ